MVILQWTRCMRKGGLQEVGLRVMSGTQEGHITKVHNSITMYRGWLLQILGSYDVKVIWAKTIVSIFSSIRLYIMSYALRLIKNNHDTGLKLITTSSSFKRLTLMSWILKSTNARTSSNFNFIAPSKVLFSTYLLAFESLLALRY